MLKSQGMFNGQNFAGAIHVNLSRQAKIVVAQNIYMSLLFISRMPNMCAIPQLVSAPLNPIPNC